jgi:hypothetical protein
VEDVEGQVERARRMLAANQYLTLATADSAGRPWASTLWCAVWQPTTPPDALDLRLLWLSRAEARHSRNLLARPEVGISIFDSTQPAGTGDGLQLEADAGRVPSAEVDEPVAVLSEASVAAGGGPWDRQKVEGPSAVLRLYAARVRSAYLLGNGERVGLPLARP